MDKKDDRPTDSPSPLSASGLPSSDRSLERVLGAIGNTIKSFESVLKMVHAEATLHTTVASMIHDEMTEQGKFDRERHELAMRLLGKVRVELATLTDQIRTLVTSNGIQLGATVDARNALDRTREKIERAADDINTGSRKIMHAEDGDAPKWSHRALNFLWPVAVRGGKAAALWGVKLATGSVVLGGIAKILHDMIAGVR